MAALLGLALPLPLCADVAGEGAPPGAGLAGALVLAMVAGFALRAAGMAGGREAGRAGFRVLACAAAAMLGFGLLGHGLMRPAVWIIGLPDRGTGGPGGLLGLPGAGAAGALPDLALAGVAAAAVAAVLGRRLRDLPGLAAMAILGAVILPVAGSWTRGGGILAGSGFRDLAGATMVYALAGWSALTGLLVLGRRGPARVVAVPAGVAGEALVLAGTALLWLGWSGSLATAGMDPAIGNGLLAGAAGLLAGHLLGRASSGGPGIAPANGLLAGLVAISANPLGPSPAAAALIGAAAVPVAFVLHGLVLRRLGDASGLVGVLLGAGSFGTLAAAVTDPAATLAGQIHGIALTGGAVAAASLAVWVILDGLLGLAAEAEDPDAPEVDPADPPALTRAHPAPRD